MLAFLNVLKSQPIFSHILSNISSDRNYRSIITYRKIWTYIKFMRDQTRWRTKQVYKAVRAYVAGKKNAWKELNE